jgi:HK97 family phage major capsid protein
MRLPALLEARASAVAAMKALLDGAASAARDLTEAESKTFEDRKAEVAQLDQRIARQRAVDDMERVTEGQSLDGAARDMRSIARRYSLVKALSEHLDGKLTGLEAEWQAEHRSGRPGALNVPASLFLGEQRVQQVGDMTKGGYLVPTEVMDPVEPLRPAMLVERLGATVMRDLTGNMELPRLTSGSVSWIGENEAVTTSDPTWSVLGLWPHTVAAQYELTRRFMIQAKQGEEILRRDIAAILATAIDAAAINGSGVNNQPTGLLNDPQVQVYSMGTNGAALAMTTIPEILALAEIANVTGTTAFVANPQVAKKVRLLVDGQSRFFTLDEVFRGEPVYFTNQVPSNLTKGSGTSLSALIYGQWSELILAFWSGIDLLANPYADSVQAKGNMLLTAFCDCDVGPRHPEAFVVVKDIVTT